MTTFKQDFEAGTVGSSVITGSAGGGNTAVAALGTAPLVTATSGEVIVGTKSAKCTAAAGASSGVNLPVTMTTDGGFHFVYTIDSAQIASAVDEVLHQWRIAAASRIAVTLRASDKKVIFVDPTGTWVSPSAATAGTYAFDVLASTGTTATAPYDGKDKWWFTNASDGSYAFGTTGPVEQLNRNLGAGGSITNFYVGALSTTGAPARAPIVDDFYAIDSYARTGPIVNIPPTVTGPSTTSVTSATASITCSATDSTGTIASFACAYQSNTLPSSATAVTPTVGTPTLSGIGTGSASATFPITGLTANARYFFGLTATDSNGASSTTPVIARVDRTADAPDIRQVDVTGFTVVGGGTALDAIIAGNAQAAAGQTVTRYLESTAPPGGSSVTITFQPMTSTSLSKAFAVPVRAKDTSSTETATVTLKMNDTTTIATRGPVTLTTTAAAVGGNTTTGTGSETAAITDHSKLSVVVVTN